MVGQSPIVGETSSTDPSMLFLHCMMLQYLGYSLIIYALEISFSGCLLAFLVHLTHSSVHVVVVSQKMVLKFICFTFTR
jgi:hypothetical protein